MGSETLTSSVGWACRVASIKDSSLIARRHSLELLLRGPNILAGVLWRCVLWFWTESDYPSRTGCCTGVSYHIVKEDRSE